MNLSIKFPIDVQDGTGVELHDDYAANIRQNLKMLILTNKGERIMNPEFGVGLKKYLFENVSNNKIIIGDIEYDIKTIILKNITEQVNKYIPDVLIQDLYVKFEDNTLTLSLQYLLSGFYQDILQINA